MLKLRIDIKLKAKLFFVFIIICFLGSCATTDIKPINQNSMFQQKDVSKKLEQLGSCQAKGVIGIIYNNKAESANYIYSQKGDSFSIKLYGPLGIGSVEIKGDSKEVELKNSKGQTARAKNAKTLMLEQLGWYVPIDGLKYWIKAQPIPQNQHKQTLNDNGLIDELSQQGWSISYKGYQIVDSQYPLPSKIRMSRNNLIIKIVIKSWQI